MTELLSTDQESGVARIVDDAEAITVARSLASAVAAGAGDRDAVRVHPHDEVAALSASGLLAITVPAAFGGADVTPTTLARVVALLAAADPSLAQIPQSHFTFLEALRRNGSAALSSRVWPRILDGARLANAQTERAGKTVTDDATTLRTTPGGFLLSGVKYYCTGALHADILAVRAVDVTGRKVVAYVAADAPGITIVDDWDGFGQRTTGSGTVGFDRVAVREDQVLDFTALLEKPGTYGARAQLIHAAIDVGIARGALDAIVPAVNGARPWFESAGPTAADDPYLIAQAGDLELAVRSAESLLLTAAQRIEDADRESTADPTSRTSSSVRDRIAEASLATAAAKVAAGRAARRAGSELFDFGGTRSASERANLSRFWRDARTHTLHDPERWKLHHLGRWALGRHQPPTHTSL